MIDSLSFTPASGRLPPVCGVVSSAWLSGQTVGQGRDLKGGMSAPKEGERPVPLNQQVVPKMLEVSGDARASGERDVPPSSKTTDRPFMCRYLIEHLPPGPRSLILRS